MANSHSFEEKNSYRLLIAEDDSDDQQMILEAFQENQIDVKFHFVSDGEALMEHLNIHLDALPHLILLDLNMPRKDGREVLQEIRQSPHFKKIPVVILTTSKARGDISKMYELGANGFVTKPVSFEALVESIGTLAKYWFKTVELPE